MAGLTNKQRAFVESYLCCWNAAEAARSAGYSAKTARSIGAENLTKPDIQAAIKQRIAEKAMSADEVLLRLADHARGNLSMFLVVDAAGALTGFDLREDRPIHLLKRASITETEFKGVKKRETTIELYDAQAALVHLGKHHKLFTDKQELTGADGQPVNIRYVNDWRSDPAE